MGDNKPHLKEGLGTMLGRLILFIAGKGPDYKNAKKKLTDPEYKKKLKKMHSDIAQLLDDFEDIRR